MRRNKYFLYENAVQSPEAHAEWFDHIFQEIRRRPALSFREDFCGTFKLSCEWVRLGPKKTAIGIDLDPEPLAYGKRVNLSALKPEEQKRVKLFRKNVLNAKVPKADIIAACNFSFFIFKKRSELIAYFRSCLKSLDRGGMLVLEVGGGPGMIKKMLEKKTVKAPGLPKTYTYVWDQRTFNPINHEATYAIHFKFRDGTQMKNAFTYDWRMWSMPELRDILVEAGFKDTTVYWEAADRGEPTGEFVRTENGDNAYSWIAYMIGLA
jgi:SAM-dependent methyltransferase